VVNCIDRTTFGHKAVKGQDQAIPLSAQHVAADEREKLLSSRANVRLLRGHEESECR